DDAKGEDIFEWLKSLFKIWFKEFWSVFNELIFFFKELIEYRLEIEKDYDREYELVKIYWKFIHELRESKINNYNHWIIYINKNIHNALTKFH
ncbi:MAG: hypothetical protein HRS50_02145, partial [Mycoplasmataceae bacterium]|nr:hypothetical protein [Mycoplasmataceae bacterium]